ncbi:hypothetical protein [Streptomyces sp. NBC_01334]|uniref:hypothetical protein n=1 Tax=Streptomyces sp. NBC_01334 TaxID=2903827 RepID=UPI002E0E47CE|nr:hypothetical protein OG736_13425 [Streptomyces sp. NBC_01334]
MTLVILAAFGCVTLLLTQISDVLSRIPQIIRAWRQVRRELSGVPDAGSGDHLARGTSPGTLAVSQRDGDPALDERGMRRDEI